MLIDYRHKPTEDDYLMYNYLKYYNVPVTIIATKYDKVNKTARPKQDKLITELMNLKDDDKLIFFSAISKKGRDEVYKIIDTFIEESV